MKLRCLVLLLVGVFLAADKAKPNVAEGDKDKIQGSWTVVAMVQRGKNRPEKAIREIQLRLTFAGEKMTFTSAFHEKEDTDNVFKLDPTKTPKEIDLTFEFGKKPSKGIYELDGDTLRICMSTERPATFSTKGKGDETITLWVLKRDKP